MSAQLLCHVDIGDQGVAVDCQQLAFFLLGEVGVNGGVHIGWLVESFFVRVDEVVVHLAVVCEDMVEEFDECDVVVLTYGVALLPDVVLVDALDELIFEELRGSFDLEGVGFLENELGDDALLLLVGGTSWKGGVGSLGRCDDA